MSTRLNIGLTIGVLIIMLISSAISVFYTKQSNDATQRANIAIDSVNKLILEGRKIGNQRGNLTLGAVGDAIHELKDTEKNILGNLTDHRMVANYTRDQVLTLSNQTNHLISQFNSTNEDGRALAVQEIIQAVNNNTELIKQLLSSHKNTG